MQTPATETAFQWDEVANDINGMPFVLLVEGLPGTGKTHLAMTFPDPIYVFDSESRADFVMAKFSNTKTVFRKRVNCFNDIRQALLRGVFPARAQGGTIVIDSASDLQKFAEAEFLEESKKTKVYPMVLWAEVYKKMDSMISTIRQMGYNLVLTARVKDEYTNGSGDNTDNKIKTGQLVMDGYKRFPYLSDMHIRLLPSGEGVVLKNGFRNGPIVEAKRIERPSYSTLRDLIGVQAQERSTNAFEPMELTGYTQEPSDGQEMAEIQGEGIPQSGGMPGLHGVATKEEIKSLFLFGKNECHLSDNQIREALLVSTGKTETKSGLSRVELADWMNQLESMAEYGNLGAEGV